MVKLKLVVETIHLIIALLITATPTVAWHYISGSFEPWTLLFGALSGLSYWYLFDPIP